jgi:hypothetical protein
MDPQQLAALIQQLQDQQALLQAQAQQLNALQAQVNQPQANVPPAPPAPPVFALTPALAQTGIINYMDSSGIKLHKSIITPLTMLYDGTASKMAAFLEDVKQRASASGWDTALLTMSNQGAPATDYHLITSHRMLTIENVRAHAATYIGQQNRLAQDSYLMYEFLRDSLTDAAHARVGLEATKYVINGTEDGPCYLKVILMKFYVETNATNFFLHQSLIGLPKKITELKSDIPAFNQYVQDTVKELAAGGETSTDLLVYLFLAYMAVEDKEFVDFIKRQKQDYDDGKENITVEVLMDRALNRHNQLVQSGTWKAKTPEEEKLIALTAQLKEAKTKIAELSKNKKKSGSGMPSTPKSGTPSSDTSSGASGGQNGSRRKSYPEWRYQRKDNENTKTHDGKTYHWCAEHKIWTNHSTKDCRRKKHKDARKNNPEKEKQGGQVTALQVAKALTAIAEGSAQSGNDDDQE